MNFMPAAVEEGKLRTKLGDIPLSDELRRSLEAANAGRDIIIGIRPEHFEDAALVEPSVHGHGIEFNANIDVVESMGSDVYVYFTPAEERGDGGGGPGIGSAELDELAADSGAADTGSNVDQITARLDAETTIREGETAKLWLDARAIHIFDPETGRSLRPAPAGAA